MRSLGTLIRSSWLTSVMVSLLVGGSIITLRQAGYLEALELVAYDWTLRVRPVVVPSPARLTLITITEQDIRQQQDWPLPDAVLAQALGQLVQHRPRVIGLDLYRDRAVPPGHAELNAVLTRHRHIVVVTKVGDTASETIPPPAVLKDTEQVGFSDILVDPGGIVRRGLLFLDEGETTSYAFALRLALWYLEAEGILPAADPMTPTALRLGRTTIRRFTANDGGYVGADAAGYQFLLDFRDAQDAFPSFSLTALLAGEITPGALADKVVLLGTTAESAKDVFYTPRSRGLRTQQHLAGVTLHAQVVSQLLRAALDGNGMVHVMSDGWEGVWILLWSVVGGLVGVWLRTPWRFVVLTAGGLLALGGAISGALWYGWWLPLVSPAMGWVLSAATVTAVMVSQEKRQRALLMQLFARHVSPEVAETIWRQRDAFLHNGRPRSQRMVVTVLFTDLMGFTSVAETMKPEALVAWVDEYMEAMVPYISTHGGVVLRFIGDAIMAVFGVPVPRTTDMEIRQDAMHAVECALAMEQALIQLNQRWHAQHRPMTGMRIGIATGPVVAGSQGSTQRLEYNIYGDTVNTASRLESVAKEDFAPDLLHRPCRTLIGDTTFRYVSDCFQTQQVGEMALKGKGQRVTVYGVSGQQQHTQHGIWPREGG